MPPVDRTGHAGAGGPCRYRFCSSGWQYGVATGVWSLGEIAYLPVAGALVAELAPAELRGRYAGAYGLTFGTAGFLAPIVGPTVLQVFGAPVLWTCCLVAGASVAAGYLALGRAVTQQESAFGAARFTPDP